LNTVHARRFWLTGANRTATGRKRYYEPGTSGTRGSAACRSRFSLRARSCRKYADFGITRSV